MSLREGARACSQTQRRKASGVPRQWTQLRLASSLRRDVRRHHDRTLHGTWTELRLVKHPGGHRAGTSRNERNQGCWMSSRSPLLGIGRAPLVAYAKFCRRPSYRNEGDARRHTGSLTQNFYDSKWYFKRPHTVLEGNERC